jgi:predicted transposase YbfD/YdcC
VDEETPQTLFEHLQTMKDPRRAESTLHPLPSILFIALCAVICGAEHWVAMEHWARSREEWLRSVIELPHGIPSHDTFARVFSLLEAGAFATMFVRWVETVMVRTKGEVVAIDGKSLRRSLAKAWGKGAVHMVSAWATGNQLVMGQVRTDEKSNEITAVPELLRLLTLRGCLVTVDALNTQKAIAEQIIEQGADYVLNVKGNHPHLHQQLIDAFAAPPQENPQPAPSYEPLAPTKTSEPTKEESHVGHSYAETRGQGHGRTEIRQLWCRVAPPSVDPDREWPTLRTIAKIQRTRIIGEQSSVEEHYFISSVPGNKVDSAATLLSAVRAHWGVENGLHWRLDVQFDEDHSTTHAGNAAENLARIRHMALNLLKSDVSVKVGIKIKRQKAGWDHKYLLKIIGVET